jgi:uncharacterized protein YkwD
MRLRFQWFLLLTALVAGLAAAGHANAPSGVPLDFKLRLLDLINHDRALAQREPVEFSAELSAAADAHCREMLELKYTSHWNRAGWKPYLRYALAGITDFTAENLWSLQQTNFSTEPGYVLQKMMEGHRNFMAEVPPNDGHRRSILEPNHTHVGIGVAYGPEGMRMIEVFGARYAELEPLPAQSRLRDRLTLRGRVLAGVHLFGIAVFYDPLPRPMSFLELAASSSYSLPREERTTYLPHGDTLLGSGDGGSAVHVPGGRFAVPVVFWKGRPGVYTVGVWVSRDGRNAFLGALTATIVTE